MTTVIARLILAMLLLPATGVVFVVSFIILVSQSRAGPPPVAAMLFLWFIVYSFVATYWIALWRKSIEWTTTRIFKTVLASALALLSGTIAGAAFHLVNNAIPVQVLIMGGGGIVPIVWVLATVIIWRETPAERVARVSKLGAGGVVCPLCGYNLAGLREARCPECGATFTLDQLVAVQADTAESLPEA